MISEQWQQVVEEFGDNAYQRIEISLSDKNRFIDATDNRDVEWALNSTNYDVRYKDIKVLK